VRKIIINSEETVGKMLFKIYSKSLCLLTIISLAYLPTLSAVNHDAYAFEAKKEKQSSSSNSGSGSEYSYIDKLSKSGSPKTRHRHRHH